MLEKLWKYRRETNSLGLRSRLRKLLGTDTCKKFKKRARKKQPLKQRATRITLTITTGATEVLAASEGLKKTVASTLRGSLRPCKPKGRNAFIQAQTHHAETERCEAAGIKADCAVAE